MPKKDVRSRLSSEHESEVAKLFGGNVTIASGAKHEKHDAVGGEHIWTPLIECKETQAASYRLDKALWEDVVANTYSRSSTLRPLISIRFYSDHETLEHDLAVVDVHDLLELRSLCHSEH